MNQANFARLTAVGLLLLLTGCGKAVDLDQPGKLVPSGEAGVLGTLEERVVQLRVDAERLYWLTDEAALRGCLKRSCASSVITYTEHDANWVLGFGVQGGELFYAQAGNPGDLMAVDAADPSHTRTLAASGAKLATTMTTDEDAVYLTDGDHITVVALSANVTDPPLVIDAPRANPLLTARILAAHGDHVYWLETDRGRGNLMRARKDGRAEPEKLAGDVELDEVVRSGSSGADVFPEFGLAVDDHHAYWTQNLLSGSIKRQPLAGGNSETIAEPLRAPMGIVLDGATLYVEHERDAFQYAVSACSVDGCELALLADKLDATDVFAVDSEYLYTATTTQSLDPDDSASTPVTQLRRSPKRREEQTR